jgi:hypothetical protein
MSSPAAAGRRPCRSVLRPSPRPPREIVIGARIARSRVERRTHPENPGVRTACSPEPPSSTRSPRVPERSHVGGAARTGVRWRWRLTWWYSRCSGVSSVNSKPAASSPDGSGKILDALSLEDEHRAMRGPAGLVPAAVGVRRACVEGDSPIVRGVRMALQPRRERNSRCARLRPWLSTGHQSDAKHGDGLAVGDYCRSTSRHQRLPGRRSLSRSRPNS